MKEIDCRGMSCPQPVIKTKQVLDQLEENEMTVIVDNPSSSENVERFVRSQGCLVRIKKKGKDFYLHIQKGNVKDEKGIASQDKTMKKAVVYINSNLLGVGDEALGIILMRTFLKTLLDLEMKPNCLILINSGVRLAAEGSDVLETLTKLSETGTEILSCGTCLDFYKLKDKLKVGVISNMYNIAQVLLEADRLIRP